MNLLTDVRYAARQLRRRWGFTAVAILTLALGIGGASAVLAIERALTPAPAARANHVLFGVDFQGRLPVNAPQQERTLESRRIMELGDIRTFRTVEGRLSLPIEAATAVDDGQVIVRTADQAEVLRARIVTGRYAEVFHRDAQFGRWLTPEDDLAGAIPVAVLSDRFFREAFGGDRSVVGQATVQISQPARPNTPVTPHGRSFTIVGVARSGSAGGPDLWLSQRSWEALNEASGVEPFLWRQVRMFVRVSPAAQPAEVVAALTSALVPAPGDPRIELISLAAGNGRRGRSETAGLLWLALFILIAAGANVANMLFARAAERAGEVSVRISLGASRVRVFRLFAMETVVIGLAAFIVALPIALGGVRLFGVAVPSQSENYSLPRGARLWAGDIAIHSPVSNVALLTLAIAGVATLGVAALAAWRAVRSPSNRILASGGSPIGIAGGRRRASLVFVAIQVTAALLLVMAAGLYAETYRATLDRRLHFDTAGLVTATVDLNHHGYTPDRGRAFYQRLAGSGALPGIQHVAIVDQVPGAGRWLPDTRPDGRATYLVAADEAGRPRVPGSVSPRLSGWYALISPGLFDTLGLRVVRGRPLWPSDALGTARVAVVTEHVAATLWSGQDPIGKRLVRDEPYTVVGVVENPASSTDVSPLIHPASYAFLSFDQHYTPQVNVLARSANPADALRALRRATRDIDPEVVLLGGGTVEGSILDWLGPLRAAAFLMGSLGLLAMVVATLGIYGALAHAVSTRRREFGVRLALGATPRRLVTMVLDQAISMLLVGLLPGVLIASLGSNTVSHWLPGVQPNSIAMWIAAPLTILAIGLAASFVPARRAALVDPNVALREL